MDSRPVLRSGKVRQIATQHQETSGKVRHKRLLEIQSQSSAFKAYQRAVPVPSEENLSFSQGDPFDEAGEQTVCGLVKQDDMYQHGSNSVDSLHMSAVINAQSAVDTLTVKQELESPANSPSTVELQPAVMAFDEVPVKQEPGSDSSSSTGDSYWAGQQMLLYGGGCQRPCLPDNGQQGQQTDQAMACGRQQDNNHNGWGGKSSGQAYQMFHSSDPSTYQSTSSIVTVTEPMQFKETGGHEASQLTDQTSLSSRQQCFQVTASNCQGTKQADHNQDMPYSYRSNDRHGIAHQFAGMNPQGIQLAGMASASSAEGVAFPISSRTGQGVTYSTTVSAPGMSQTFGIKPRCSGQGLTHNMASSSFQQAGRVRSGQDVAYSSTQSNAQYIGQIYQPSSSNSGQGVGTKPFGQTFQPSISSGLVVACPSGQSSKQFVQTHQPSSSSHGVTYSANTPNSRQESEQICQAPTSNGQTVAYFTPPSRDQGLGQTYASTNSNGHGVAHPTTPSKGIGFNNSHQVQANSRPSKPVMSNVVGQGTGSMQHNYNSALGSLHNFQHTLPTNTQLTEQAYKVPSNGQQPGYTTVPNTGQGSWVQFNIVSRSSTMPSGEPEGVLPVEEEENPWSQVGPLQYTAAQLEQVQGDIMAMEQKFQAQVSSAYQPNMSLEQKLQPQVSSAYQPTMSLEQKVPDPSYCHPGYHSNLLPTNRMLGLGSSSPSTQAALVSGHKQSVLCKDHQGLRVYERKFGHTSQAEAVSVYLTDRPVTQSGQLCPSSQSHYTMAMASKVESRSGQRAGNERGADVGPGQSFRAERTYQQRSEGVISHPGIGAVTNSAVTRAVPASHQAPMAQWFTGGVGSTEPIDSSNGDLVPKPMSGGGFGSRQMSDQWAQSPGLSVSERVPMAELCSQAASPVVSPLKAQGKVSVVRPCPRRATGPVFVDNEEEALYVLSLRDGLM